MKPRETPPTRGLVGIAMHVLLAILRFWGDSEVRKTLLKILHYVCPDSIYVSLRERAGRNESDHLVHEPLHNTHAELKVDDCIGEVETSNVNAHSGLRLWDSGCGVRLDDSVPRLRIFFVNSGRYERRNDTNGK